MKTINIIDTSQLINDANIVEEIVKREQTLYIPISVKNELSKILDNKIFDKEIVTRIIYAKKILKKYSKSIIFWQSGKAFADSAIQQLILEKMCDNSIKTINIYTSDKMLAQDCYDFNESKSIRHSCSITVMKYVDGRETVIPYVAIYPKYISSVDIIMWRNGELVSDINKANSLCEEKSSIHTLTGNEMVTKFWAWYTKKNDVLRIFKRIKLHKGECVKVNVVNFESQSVIRVALVAYRESDKTELKPSEYVKLEAFQWKNLELYIDDDYDYINIDFVMDNDSVLVNTFDFNGVSGYIDGFQITQK